MTNTLQNLPSSPADIIRSLRESADTYYNLYRKTLKEKRALEERVEDLRALVAFKESK